MTTDGGTKAKIIVLCENCSQKLSLPKIKQTLAVTCPKCRYQFDYRYNAFAFSPSTKRYLLAGFVGGLIGFGSVEIANLTILAAVESALLSSALAISAFGTCLGAVMGATEGFFKKDWGRLIYGLKAGAVLGLISGLIAGLIAQVAYGGLLGSAAPDQVPSLGLIMFARTAGWCVLGLLIGVAYGIKENTAGDLKFGLIGGAIGGAVGGLLFDPLASLIPMGGGTAGRLVGFTVLGVAVCVAINRFRESALKRNRPEMYQQLTPRLPANPRMLLPRSCSQQK